MATPSTSLATLRPDLGGSLEEFNLAMDRQGFIGHLVLPVLEVARPSGKFGRIPIESLLQNRETRRSSKSGYNRGDYQFTEDSYATEEHGFEEPVDDRDAEIYGEYFDAELYAAERARDAVMRAYEIRAAALVFNTSTWTGDALTTGISTVWSNHTDATPIDDVEAAILAAYNGSGLWPNALIVNRLVFRHLRQCAQIIDRIESAGAGSAAKAADITAAQLASVFDVDRVIVAGASRNTADEGQSAALSQIWASDKAMVARVATGSDIKEPCLGRTLHWGQDGSTFGAAMETYRDETVRADIVRARMETDEKVFHKEAAHLLTGITQ